MWRLPRSYDYKCKCFFFTQSKRGLKVYLQTEGSLPHPALLQLGFINDAVEFGNLILQLLCPLAQSLHLLRQTACLALGCLQCRLNFLLFLTGCNVVLEERTKQKNTMLHTITVLLKTLQIGSNMNTHFRQNWRIPTLVLTESYEQ